MSDDKLKTTHPDQVFAELREAAVKHGYVLFAAEMTSILPQRSGVIADYRFRSSRNDFGQFKPDSKVRDADRND